MAQFRRSKYTRRKPKVGGGLLPSFLTGKKSPKETAWKKHIETRSPFMNNLKNMLEKREKTCGDKDSKKTKRIISRLKKSMKLSEVNKFVKELKELSELIKKWDKRVLTYAVDLGKKCGMFEVIPQDSDIRVFIAERIEFEQKNDPELFVYDVVPVRKPGTGTGVERDRYGRFTRRVGSDLTRTDRDDIRRAMNRRIIQTRADRRADEIQFGKKTYGKDKLTSWDKDWFENLTKKYDIDNIPAEKRDALLRYYEKKNSSDKRNDPRYYPDGKGYDYDRSRFVDPLRRETRRRRTIGKTDPVNAARERARAMAAARATAAADRITRETRDSGVSVSPGVSRIDPVDAARERARAMAAARATAAADRITRETRDGSVGTSPRVRFADDPLDTRARAMAAARATAEADRITRATRDSVSGTPEYFPGEIGPIESTSSVPPPPPDGPPPLTQTKKKGLYERTMDVIGSAGDYLMGKKNNQEGVTQTDTEMKEVKITKDSGTDYESLLSDAQTQVEPTTKDSQVGTEVETNDVQTQAMPNGVEISVGTDITGDLPNQKEQSFAQTQAHKLAGMYEASQSMNRKQERDAAKQAIERALAQNAANEALEALKKGNSSVDEDPEQRKPNFFETGNSSVDEDLEEEKKRTQSRQRERRARRRERRFLRTSTTPRVVPDSYVEGDSSETNYHTPDEDFDPETLSVGSDGTPELLTVGQISQEETQIKPKNPQAMPPLGPDERLPLPPSGFEIPPFSRRASDEQPIIQGPESTSNSLGLGQDMPDRLAHQNPTLFTQIEEPSFSRRMPPPPPRRLLRSENQKLIEQRREEGRPETDPTSQS